MIVKKFAEVKKEKVTMADTKDTYVRWLIGEDSPAPHFHMRLFEIEPGGHTPFHSHDFEHEVYILSGNGRLNTEVNSIILEKDSFALVMPGEKHQFENTGNTSFKFLCLIPKEQKCK